MKTDVHIDTEVDVFFIFIAYPVNSADTVHEIQLRQTLCQRWASASSNGRSQATSLVNAYLSLIYMSAMKLGVSSDFPDVKENALRKLFKQQELHRRKLLKTFYC
uniref:Uncharacterized protein n=1 Tax=Kalanchoe fedtschenkoi TaxID=63787 RepID=A0A7N0U2J6_KALFE